MVLGWVPLPVERRPRARWRLSRPRRRRPRCRALRPPTDFVLAFALVHEMPNAQTFFAEVAKGLVPGGRLLVAEPRGHVGEEEFKNTLDSAAAAGLRVAEPPLSAGAVRRCWFVNSSLPQGVACCTHSSLDRTSEDDR